jgi:hypothetical protein
MPRHLIVSPGAPVQQKAVAPIRGPGPSLTQTHRQTPFGTQIVSRGLVDSALRNEVWRRQPPHPKPSASSRLIRSEGVAPPHGAVGTGRGRNLCALRPMRSQLKLIIKSVIRMLTAHAARSFVDGTSFSRAPRGTDGFGLCPVGACWLRHHGRDGICPPVAVVERYRVLRRRHARARSDRRHLSESLWRVPPPRAPR